MRKESRWNIKLEQAGLSVIARLSGKLATKFGQECNIIIIIIILLLLLYIVYHMHWMHVVGLRHLYYGLYNQAPCLQTN